MMKSAMLISASVSAFDRQLLLVPVEHSALEIRHVLEPEARQHCGRRGAADPCSADSDDLLVLVTIKLGNSRRQLAKWNQDAARNVPQLASVFVRLTDIEQHHSLGVAPPLIDLLRRKLPDLVQLREARKLYRVIVDCALIRLQRLLDLLREREAEIVHQLDVSLTRATGDARVRAFLFRDRRVRMAAVIVRGINER